MTPDELLLREAKKTAHALGIMFAPFCEVVLHDLRELSHSIIAIENNFSGRRVGDASTNVGLQRVKNKQFPDVLQNYQNTLPDGRTVKSTSIGIRNANDKYIGSICLNFDTTLFSSFATLINEFTSIGKVELPVQEELKAASIDEINKIVLSFASKESTTPQRLSSAQRRKLVKVLKDGGYMRLQNAIPTIANILGVSRGSIYNYQKSA